MSFCTDVVLPRLCHLAMRNRNLVPYRRRVVRAAEGRVLEVGAGSGLNLGLYPAAVREVVALELSLPLIEMARRRTGGSVPVTLLAGSAEAIPLDDGCIDTVVTTWTLCTIGLPDIALAEMRRVLRRRGRLLFVEHGLAPDEGVRRWQNRVTPLWKRLSGGCHLNRPIRELIADNGFDVERLEVGYMAGLKIMSFTYEGAAVPS